MKSAVLLIYQESPDISDILLSSFDAKSSIFDLSVFGLMPKIFAASGAVILWGGVI
jgi:hypothetical protein